MIKHYLNLIKPNIVIGNTMSSIGGFSIASKGHMDFSLFIPMIIGIALIIAASCILNNIIDRDIDSTMQRTKNRILAKNIKNTTFLKQSILCALILSVIGFLSLNLTKNFLIMYLAAIGYFIYIGIYSLWMKRKSIYSIIIGSISGSMPPMVGYCTITNTIDAGAIILLIMFSLWQIPHSYAIYIARLDDYKIALIPTFPTQKGIPTTIHHMIIYIIGFIITTVSLTIMEYTSYFFLFIINSINIFWLYTGCLGYKHIRDNNITMWAKKMFLLSIIIIISTNLLLPLDCIIFSHHHTYNI